MLFMYQLYAHHRVRRIVPVSGAYFTDDALLTCDYIAHYNPILFFVF